MILRTTIDRIRREVPITKVLAPMGTSHRCGHHERMHCIAHDDHHPSLDIYPDRNYCICRACGWCADPIGAYQKVCECHGEVISFVEAVRALAHQYHIPIEETPTDPKYKEAADAAKKRTDHAFALNQLVADHYHEHLHHEIGQGSARTTAHNYFTSRGLTQQTIDTFHLGGVPHTSPAFVDLLGKQGYTPQDITTYQLFRENRNHDWQSPIHDRVVYPLHNHMGRIVGFAGRKLPNPEQPQGDTSPKYINSSESDIYHKHQLLYGLYQAKATIRKYDRCYLVEGYQDVLAMHQAQITETVALCGTALTIEHVRLLHRFTDQCILMLDSDSAGQTAMLRHLDTLLQAGCYVSIVVLPQGQDPDDYLRTYIHTHPDATRDTLIASFAPMQQDWLTHICHLTHHLSGKALRQAQENIFKLLSLIPDKVRQEQAIKQTTQLLDINYGIVTYEVKNALHRSSPKRGEVGQRLGVVGKKPESPAQTLLRHLVLYGTYRHTPDAPETAIAHWVYQDLLQDNITLKNPILQQLLEATHQAHTQWLATQEASPTTCNSPCLLLSYLQDHQDPKVCECATRIYHQQMSQLLTYGEDAKPSPTEVLDIVETQVLHLKITIIKECIKKLSQNIFNALEQNDINQYKALNQEKKQWTEMLRVAWKKMKG